MIGEEPARRSRDLAFIEIHPVVAVLERLSSTFTEEQRAAKSMLSE